MSKLPKISIAPGKGFFFPNGKNTDIFSYFSMAMYSVAIYSLEAIRRGGASNGYLEQKFSWRKRKHIHVLGTIFKGAP